MIDELSSGLSFLPLQFSRNPIDYVVPAADVDLTDRSDLRYFLEVEKPLFVGSSDWETLRQLEGKEKPPFAIAGTLAYEGTRFRINRGRGGMIDSLTDYIKPLRNQAVLSANLSQVAPYRLTAQVQGGTPVQNTTDVLPAFYAIKAGLDTVDFALHGESFFQYYQAEARQFLTWQPDNKRVAMGQEEYLHFLINFSPLPSEIRLRAHFFNYGGLPTDPVTVLSLSNVPQYSLVCAPVGPAVVGAEEYDYYEVWLSDQDDQRLSQVRRYQLDRSYTRFDRGILFCNSLGGWDTLRLTGKATETLSVSQVRARRERPDMNNPESTEWVVVNTQGNRGIQISTGYFRRDTVDTLRWLDELLLSECCYLITPKGHLPLQIETNSLIDAEDDPELVARVISFRMQETIENFSRIPITETIPLRPTTWVGDNIIYTLDAFGKRTGEVLPATLRKAYANNFELVLPYEVKPNAPGDPDYIAPFVDVGVAPGSTPYPNAAINRIGNFVRNNCGAGYYGEAPVIVIAAGKYGGETAGAADVLAEAEFVAKDNQTYANANGTCHINYQSAAISRPSVYLKNNCIGSQTGLGWTVVVAAGAFNGATQLIADNLAIAYAASIDTQANANTNGSCIAGHLYSLTPAAGKANLRVYENKSNDYRVRRYSTPVLGPVIHDSPTDFEIDPGEPYLVEMYTTGGEYYGSLYKNGMLVSNSFYIGVAANAGGWFGANILDYTTVAAGDLLYVVINTQT